MIDACQSRTRSLTPCQEREECFQDGTAYDATRPSLIAFAPKVGRTSLLQIAFS